jgi:hypothetical protein
MKIQFLTSLESHVFSNGVYGGDDIDKILIPYRKGGVKAPSFLTGFTNVSPFNLLSSADI